MNLISWLMRRFMWQAVNRGMRAGMDYGVTRGRPVSALSPDEKQKLRAQRRMARRARQALRIGRRLGR